MTSMTKREEETPTQSCLNMIMILRAETDRIVSVELQQQQ